MAKELCHHACASRQGNETRARSRIATQSREFPVCPSMHLQASPSSICICWRSAASCWAAGRQPSRARRPRHSERGLSVNGGTWLAACYGLAHAFFLVGSIGPAGWRAFLTSIFPKRQLVLVGKPFHVCSNCVSLPFCLEATCEFSLHLAGVPCASDQAISQLGAAVQSEECWHGSMRRRRESKAV